MSKKIGFFLDIVFYVFMSNFGINMKMFLVLQYFRGVSYLKILKEIQELLFI